MGEPHVSCSWALGCRPGLAAQPAQGLYLRGAQDQPFLILLQAWLSPPDGDLTAGCLVLIELRLLGIDNPGGANAPGKGCRCRAALLTICFAHHPMLCWASHSHSEQLHLAPSFQPHLPAPVSTPRISLLGTSVTSPLCAAGKSLARHTRSSSFEHPGLRQPLSAAPTVLFPW